MSLIHDALRKAAEENQNRHGQRDRPASWRDVAPPPPPRRSPWPLVTATVLLAAGGLLLGWMQLQPAASPQAQAPLVATVSPPAGPPTTAAPAAAPPQATAPTPQPAPPVTEAPASELPAAATPTTAVPTTAAPDAASSPPPARPESRPAAAAAERALQPLPAPPPPVERPATLPATEPAPVAERVATTTPAANPAAPKLIVPPVQTGQVEGDTYVLEAEVGGKRLLLDFIVWSDSPFAQINGRQVGIGQQVEGFVVTDIARDSVLLETPTQRVRLRVR